MEELTLKIHENPIEMDDLGLASGDCKSLRIGKWP